MSSPSGPDLTTDQRIAATREMADALEKANDEEQAIYGKKQGDGTYASFTWGRVWSWWQKLQSFFGFSRLEPKEVDLTVRKYLPVALSDSGRVSFASRVSVGEDPKKGSELLAVQNKLKVQFERFQQLHNTSSARDKEGFRIDVQNLVLDPDQTDQQKAKKLTAWIHQVPPGVFDESMLMLNFKLNSATLLHWAAEKGQAELAKAILEKFPTIVGKQDSYQNTALHLAVQQGHTDVALVLIEAKASVSTLNENKETPLHVACRLGDIAVVRACLRKRDLEPKTVEKKDNITKALGTFDECKSTPLQLAIEHGHKNVALALIKGGAPVSIHKPNYPTPLHTAIQHDQTDVALALINAAVPISEPGENGRTPLHLACVKGNITIVRALLKEKEQKKQPWAMNDFLNSLDQNEKTPLELALEHGHTNVALALIKAGALDELGESDRFDIFLLALPKICRNRDLTLLRALIEREQMIWPDAQGENSLIQAIIHKYNKDNLEDLKKEEGGNTPIQLGQSPLHLACQRGNLKVLKALLEQAKPALKNRAPEYLQYKDYLLSLDNSGKSVLHYAAAQPDSAFIEMLLPDVSDTELRSHFTDPGGETALHLAAAAGNLKGVRLLLDRGGNNLLTAGKVDESPIIYALKNRRTEAAKFLIDRADVKILGSTLLWIMEQDYSEDRYRLAQQCVQRLKKYQDMYQNVELPRGIYNLAQGGPWKNPEITDAGFKYK